MSADAPVVEVGHGQGEHAAGEVIEDGGVDVHRGETEHEALQHVRKEHESEGGDHGADHRVQQRDVALDDDAVDDDLGEDGQQQLQRAGDHREKENLREGDAKGLRNCSAQPQGRPLSGALSKAGV